MGVIANRLRCKMTILEYIIQSLTNLGGKAHYSDLYDEFERLSGRKVDRIMKASIHSVIQRYSSDSTQFTGKRDIFYSVYGIGNGTWGLRSYRK